GYGEGCSRKTSVEIIVHLDIKRPRRPCRVERVSTYTGSGERHYTSRRSGDNIGGQVYRGGIRAHGQGKRCYRRLRRDNDLITGGRTGARRIVRGCRQCNRSVGHVCVARRVGRIGQRRIVKSSISGTCPLKACGRSSENGTECNGRAITSTQG